MLKRVIKRTMPGKGKRVMGLKGKTPFIIMVMVFALLAVLLAACGETSLGNIVPVAGAVTAPATQPGSIADSLPATPTATAAPTSTPEPAATAVPTATAEPTATAVPPTATKVPPTATAVPPTPTRVPPTPTKIPPTPTKVPPTATPKPDANQAAATGGKWIDVNLTTQKLVAYEGKKPVVSGLISSGTADHKTVTGDFNIYLKYVKQDMVGGEGREAYDLKDVPNVMYFYQDYSIHGAYWHHNWGHVMSHGCVNTPLDMAKTLYNWAPLGTPVHIHY